MGAGASAQAGHESLTKDQLVYMAKLSEQAERYDEMFEEIKSLNAISTTVLNEAERNLASVAAKNAVGSRRSAYRMLCSIKAAAGKVEQDSEIDAAALCDVKIAKVKKEIEQICADVQSGVDAQYDLAMKEADETKAFHDRMFYLKMRGDYYRYLAEQEVADGAPAEDSSQLKAKKAYEDATACFQNASQEVVVRATDPIRLGLALNQSVFFYEILGKKEDACAIAKQAFDSAISELDELGEEEYKDSTLIMQLLRDNLTLWTTETGAEAEGAPAE